MRSHDTDRFNMAVLIRIKNIYEEEYKAVNLPLITKDCRQLSKT